MILKKPYAFLIKYFRVIHLLITFLLGFVVFKYYKLITLFNSFIDNKYMFLTTYDLGNTYVPIVLFICIIFVVILSLVIMFLLKHKDKPYAFYIFTIIVYLVYLGVLVYFRGLLGTFADSLLEASRGRSIRDLLLIGLIPQAIFCILYLCRSFGINFSKLNFKDDIKDLSSSEDDSEEFEFRFNLDSYKTKRYFRKASRGFVTLIKENIIAISILVVGIVGFSIYMRYDKTHGDFDLNYSEGKTFIFNKASYTVVKSMVDNKDFNGNIIDPDKNFLVVVIKINNTTGNVLEISPNYFRYVDGESLIYPSSIYNKYFIDFGPTTNPLSIAPNAESYLMVVFDIGGKVKSGGYKLSIYNGEIYDKWEYVDKTIYISLKPKVDFTKIESNYNKVGLINLSDSNLGDASLEIVNFKVYDKYVYKKSSCKNDICTEYNELITPTVVNGRSNNSILIINVDFISNDDGLFFRYNKELKYFAEAFVYTEYYYDDHLIRDSINITPSGQNEFIALEVSNSFINNKDSKIIVSVRDHKYKIDFN